MSPDESLKATDVPFRQIGIGHASKWQCGACAKVKGVVGRKLKRVMGLRQYVCAGCNEKWLAP